MTATCFKRTSWSSARPLASPHNCSVVMNGADSGDTEEVDGVMYTSDTSNDKYLDANFSSIEAVVKECDENFNSEEFYQMLS